MPAPSCQDLKRDLEAVKKLAASFDRAFEESVRTGNLDEAKRLKAEIEKRTALLKEKLVPPEIRELHLERQYAEQVAVLEKSGLLETLPSGERGIAGIDGKPYPLPSLETVMKRVLEKKDVLKEKKRQGFVKLTLVPFGLPLDKLVQKYGDRLKEHRQQGKLKATNGDTLDLDRNTPVSVWDQYQNADKDGTLVYDPSSFTEENHGGKTKTELLREQASRKDPVLGWRLLLLEDNPDLPGQGEGKTVGGRKQLEANKTPRDYLQTIGKTGSAYAHESGLTPEDWLAYALSELETKDRVLDDYQGRGKISYLTGSWFPGASVVPRAYWLRDVRRAELDGYDASNAFPNFASRSAVRI